MNQKEEKLRTQFEIQRLSEQGLSQRQIAKQTSVPRSTVQDILKKLSKHNTVMRVKGSGRKKSLEDKDRTILFDNVRKNPMSSAKKLAVSLARETGKSVTPRTIQNELKGQGLVSAVPRKIPRLSEKNISDRLKKTIAWSSWPLKQWDRVLFSDETKINLFSSDGRVRVWRKPKRELVSENCVLTVKHGGRSEMLWGCMSSKGVGRLVFVEGIMDKMQYKRILAENLDASRDQLGLSNNFIFQQDNDPKHKSKYVQDFFAENDIEVLDWPSQSPDLNPIEHLWDHIKREVRKVAPKNLKQLKEEIIRIWGEITPDLCKRLVHSMPRRIEEVVRVKGKSTKY
jgi:transposase